MLKAVRPIPWAADPLRKAIAHRDARSPRRSAQHRAGTVSHLHCWICRAFADVQCETAGWKGTETSEELTARADAALYLAKNAGRNQIAEAEPQAVPADYRTHRIDSR
jgi:GGDEF domain-containing protein